MVAFALGISGRLIEGQTLRVDSVGTFSSLQWQVDSGTGWVNVGTPGSLTFVLPAGASGKAYRVIGTSTEGEIISAATPPVMVETNKARAPVISGGTLTSSVQEQGAATTILSALAFADADNSNYSGGSLAVLNSNALAAGGDGLDALSIRVGTGQGKFSYNATTRELSYGIQNNGQHVVIGVLDAGATGNGTNLVVRFNSSTTKAAVDALIDNITFASSDDSPLAARLLTLRVTDGTGRVAQQGHIVNVAGTNDLPVFTGAATLLALENQAAAGTITAADPDVNAGSPSGLSFSLVGGAGADHNAAFTIDAQSGALNFVQMPDFESAAGTMFNVRVRVTDGAGTSAERAYSVQVQNVNEAPTLDALSASLSEDSGPLLLATNAADPDGGAAPTLSVNTTGTIGTAALSGTNVSYSMGTAFQSLRAGQTATDSFTVTATDSEGLTVSQTATVTVTGVNDAAVITGQGTGAVTEDAYVGADGLVRATGTLSVTDIDTGEAQFQAGRFTTALNGALTIDGNGAWHYEFANANLQSLGAGATRQDTVEVHSLDGTARTITVTQTGVNDAPRILNPGGTPTAQEVNQTGGYLVSTFEFSGQERLSFVNDAADNTLVLARTGDTSVVRRVSSDGFYDPNFGTNGSTAVAGFSAEQINLDAQGRALIVGTKLTSFSINGVQTYVKTPTVMRLLSDGSVDVSFGVNGTSSFTMNHPVSQAVETWTLGDGKTVVTGYVGNETGNDWWIARLNADGSLDTSFRNGGSSRHDANGEWSHVELTSDNKVLISSVVQDSTGKWITRVERQLLEGGVDTSFGNDGVIDLDLGAMPIGMTVARALPDGKLMVLSFISTSTNADHHIVFTRLNSDGTLDPSFGEGGTVETPFEDGAEFAVDAMGRLVLATGSSNLNSRDGDLVVARYLNDGSLDTSFGSDGFASLHLGPYAGGYHVSIADDGNILVGGKINPYEWNRDEPIDDMLIARFNGDGSLDNTFSRSVDSPIFGTLIAIDPDTNVASGTWAVTNAGTYGTFSIEQNGNWSYLLDSSRPVTDDLSHWGTFANEYIRLEYTDSAGFTQSTTLSIQVMGSYDPSDG